MQIANMIHIQTMVYIEGARTIDDIGNISSGSGIWYAQGDERNTSLKYRADLNSNDLGELLAVLWAINEEPPHNNLTIKTKSAHCVKAILENIKTWEQTRYIGVTNRDIFQAVVASLRNRGGPTYFIQLKDERTLMPDAPKQNAWPWKELKRNTMMSPT
jgi:ribonuclease HI